MTQPLAPKLTVLMPVYNTREDWLRIAIAGIACQTYPNLDLRIGDDASTKASTVETLRLATERYPDRVFVHRRAERGGTARALDEALRHADSATTYFDKADSDDIFHVQREANRVKVMETLPPQVAIVYDNYYQMAYEPLPHLTPIILRPYDYRAYLDSSYIPGNSLWRASVYERWGGPLKESFVYPDYDGKANRHAEDYAHWLAITDFSDAFWSDGDPAFTWTYRFYKTSKYLSDRKGVDYARALLQNRAKERRGLA